MPAVGLFLCLASAACFGAMGIFGKLAFAHGATIGTLLVMRFAVASLVLWAVLAATGRLSRLRSLSLSDLVLALGLGAVGYSAQAGAYFAALQRISPGLLGLLLYTFPAMVTIAAIRLGRERASRRTAGALTLTSGGLVLVLVGAGAGATVTLTTGSLVAGDLHPGALTGAGSGWLLAIALVSTVAAIVLFFAGLHRVGPTAASILSTFEPFVTVALAGAAFGETLSPLQLSGGVLIVAGVVALNARREPVPVPAPAVASG